jgi:hypothetical protein
MGSLPRRSRSPIRRRSRSPPPRGTTRGSRRDEEERKRYRDSGLPRDFDSRRDYKGYRRTDGSDEKYGRGNRDDRNHDSFGDVRDDEKGKKTRFDDTRKLTGDSSTLKSPLSASSVKEASITHSSHSRRSSQTIEESLPHSAGSGPTRTSEMTDSPKASKVISTPSAASGAPKEPLSREFNVALQQNPLPRSIVANIDAQLEPRAISAEESNLINDIWDHRVELVSPPYAFNVAPG